MKDKKEKAEKAKVNHTTRLSTEEINRKAKNKKVKDFSKTQIVGKEITETVNKKDKKTGKKKKQKFKQKHPRIATIIKIILILILLFVIICAGIFFGALWGGFNFFDLLSDEYKIDLESLVVSSENSYIYDADGNEIGSLSGGAKRISLTLDEMGKYIPKAYVAIEDERFYEHSGVDFKRTAAATLTYLTHKGSSSFGGSTITQQVVKNITQDKQDTAQRKVKEMVKALQVEHILSKDQILELYLNLIFVGGKDVNGVGLGAIYYFNKDVQELSLAECAYMAAINNSPNMYDPFKEDDQKQSRIEKGEKRAKVVLKKMKELGFIKEQEYKDAIAEVDNGLPFENGDTNITTLVSYQVDAAIDEIIKQLAEQENISTAAAKVKLYGSGYKIYVSQRTSLQNEIEEEMKNWDRYHLVSTTYKDGKPDQDSMSAMAIVDPKTGEVVACGAGIGEEKSKTYLGYYNYCTDMLKQTGSTMKPLAVLASGLENGKLTPACTFYDGATTFAGVYNANGTKKVYQDEGGYRNGYMTLRDAIAHSVNIPNLKAISIAGTDKAAEFVRSLGISDVTGDIGIGLALGGLPNGASTVQMAAAYAAISNGGIYIVPTFYQKVTDKKGNIVLQPKSVEERSTRVMSEQNAYIVKNVMQGTVSYGTAAGYGKIPNHDTASKTGTTNNDYDRWYVTLTNYYAAACWFGYEYNAAVQWPGANPAGSICSNVMKDIHKDLEASSFSQPNGIYKMKVCKYSGMLAGEGCHDTYEEIFVKGTEPKVCDKHMTVKLCVETGKLASEWCQNTVEEVRNLPPDTEAAGKWQTTYLNILEVPTEVCPHTASSYTYED